MEDVFAGVRDSDGDRRPLLNYVKKQENKMQIIERKTYFQLNGPSAAAIGKFDGIHRGHQALLHRVLEQKDKGLQAVVFTFDPSPAVFFSGEDLPELTTREEKRRLFAQLGIDVLIEYPLDFRTAAMEPERFIEEILDGQMKTAYIAAGEDLSFGREGRGDAGMLTAYASRFGYEAEIIKKICLEGVEISSSYVREVVKQGDMELAERLIGEPYSVRGIVAHGKRLGRRLGMPTVNLWPEKEKLLPPYGVYFSEVILGEKTYRGITNIGCKPTVNEENRVGVETYLYDFAQDIYGKEITVRLFSFHRAERKFASVEALKAQMAADIARGRYYVHGK